MLRISCLALALTSAAPASATIMQAVYTGTVNTSNDQTGLFGIVGSLDGLGYSLTYVYDTSIGTAATAPGYSRVFGADVGGPVTSTSLTINGVTQTVPASSLYGNYFSDVSASDAGYPNPVDPALFYNSAHMIDYDSPGGFISTTIQIYNGWDDPSLTFPQGVTTPLSLSSSSQAFAGIFQFYVYDFSTSTYSVNSSGVLLPSTLTVTQLGTPPTPAPLPAALPLMAGALAGLAVLARRRRVLPL